MRSYVIAKENPRGKIVYLPDRFWRESAAQKAADVLNDRDREGWVYYVVNSGFSPNVQEEACAQ